MEVYNEETYKHIKNKEYDKISDKELGEQYQTREEAETKYEKYKEKYKDNPNLVKAINKNDIYECLCEFSKLRLSHENMDVFVEELDKIPDRIIKNVPSMIKLYKYKSNAGCDKAFRYFAPKTANLEGTLRYANSRNAKNVHLSSKDGYSIFTAIIKAYVREEHQRLTGRTPKESMDLFLAEKANVQDVHKNEPLEKTFSRSPKTLDDIINEVKNRASAQGKTGGKGSEPGSGSGSGAGPGSGSGFGYER